YKIADIQCVDGAIEALKLAHVSGYVLIFVTNQSVVARGYYKETDVQILHYYMGNELFKSGAPILHFYYCPHHKDVTV
ncbi:D,D-heptose 1,7-bisphosphate phosphatase, partial [Veillonella atypica]|nr:D,D-heptose 1,7-bisphosphate phosphatase [Veillonella atypica]